MLDEKALAQHANRFRSAIETAVIVAPRSLSIGLWNFPHGACGDATIMLLEYLSTQGADQLHYMSGRASDGSQQSHAWALVDGWYVDITGDQGNFNRPPVVVEQPEGWFAQWEDRQTLDISSGGYVGFAEKSMVGFDLVLAQL